MLPGFLILLLVTLFRTEAKCPEYDSKDACSCRTIKDIVGKEFSTISCRNLESVSALQRVLRASRGQAIFELELLNCDSLSLPHDAFVGTTMEVLSIRNSSIQSLTDSSVAFEGLDQNLQLFEIVDCTYASDFDWGQLRNLKNLREIHVSDSDITDPTKGLASISHINIGAFIFQKNGMTFLADDAFAPFVYLERLNLDNNFISEVKRSMFPEPAEYLKILGLSGNKLTDLPEDLFINMPRLKTIYLAVNPLQTMSEITFRPIWKQLRFILFYDTRLSCDCRLTWLTREDNSRKSMHAECDGPAGFKGRLLKNLREEELWC